MKGVLPWLVRWVRRAGTRDFYPALATLWSAQDKIFFLTVHYFYLYVPIAPWTGSRAGPPVSECVFSMIHVSKKPDKDSSARCTFDYTFLVAVYFLLIIVCV